MDVFQLSVASLRIKVKNGLKGGYTGYVRLSLFKVWGGNDMETVVSYGSKETIINNFFVRTMAVPNN